PCSYVETAPRLMDVAGAVKAYLEDARADRLDVDMTTVGRVGVGEVERYRERNGPNSLAKQSPDLCQVVIASFDARLGESFIGHVSIHLSDDAVPRFSVGPAERFGPASPGGVCSFGESEYLNTVIYGGVGCRLLSPDTIKYVLERRVAGETALDDAIRTVRNILAATSAMTTIVAPRTGIGGPTKVVLLGSDGVQKIECGPYGGDEVRLNRNLPTDPIKP
ncbi:MAG: hypothetical protein J0H08_09730, partial [Rhizobiales bacterium]|nr:hypothetical protein [Hyphomicrobiales bacterium]